MNIDFNPYYDAIHRPYFAFEQTMLEYIPFRVEFPFMVKSIHANSIPFMAPEVPLVLVSLYLVVCLLGRSRSSRFNHPSFVMLVNLYNAALVALSIFMSVTVFVESSRLRYSWFNNHVDESINGLPLAKALSVFYLSKFPELFDTVIMAVKGNTRQISFLHVYHHISIIVICYCLIYSSPGSDTYWPSFLNSCVHSLMYSYYLLTSMQIGRFFTLKIKRFMTQLQMVFNINLASISVDYCAIVI